jgi:hypothetical protein
VNRFGGIDDTIWLQPQSVLNRPSRRPLNRITLILFLAIIVVGIGLATVSILSAKDYGTPAFWRLPRHIGYCGRMYQDQGARTGNPRIFTAQNGALGAKWTFLSWTFGGDSIYAAVAPQHPPDDTVCTMELYIPITGSKWETYVLSGDQ